MKNDVNTRVVPFEELPIEEKITITASSKLIKYFRGVENAGMIDKENASNLIGCVKKLVSISSERAEKLARLQIPAIV